MTDEANNDPISDALNMVPLESIIDRIEAEGHDDSAKKDFEYARSNLYEVIQIGQDSLQKLGQIATSSQHPRAFEVLSGLMKTIVDANKDLMTLQKNIKDLKDAEQPHNDKAKTINNNLFVGSTAELQKMIQSLNKDE
jgi:hypothetical protein